MKHNKLVATLILVGLTTMANAQINNPSGGSNGTGGGERPHGPPPQAIAACNNKASGTVCSFVGRENKMLTGTCFAPPGGNHPLACRPDRSAQGMGGQGGGYGGQGMGGQRPSGQGSNGRSN